MSLFERRHYKKVAEVISNEATETMRAGDGAGAFAVHEVMIGFVHAFEADNPRFDRKRFIDACGFEDIAKEGE